MKAQSCCVALVLATGCITPSPGAVSAEGRKVDYQRLPGGACALPKAIELASPVNAEIAFEVHPAEAVGKISPLIYGTNGAGEIEETHQTVVRMGGNRMTAYNWENNASNAGSDWKFQNDDNLGSSNEPALAVINAMKPAVAHGAAALVTVPMVDWVAADKRGGGDVRNSGPDYLKQRFRHNRARKGSPFAATPDAGDDSVYEDEFVDFLHRALPKAQLLFDMDNEPDLWSSTHKEVHPDPVRYDELVARTIEFSSAVKDVMKDAEVLGFVSYGYNGFTSLQNAPDSKANGDFVEFFLRSMKAAEASHGHRLVDYLDLHWYPEARGGGARITESKNSDDVIEARLQAPRSLWDSEYKEDSWISKNAGAINLIPRMKAKIDQEYPGTKLAFTEWNYGGGSDISGGLAAADALGVFGCTGVSLASEWSLGGKEPYFHAAMRAFRNFDGHGAAFGDTAVFSQTSDRVGSSVYASTDSSHPGRLLVMLINKVDKPQRATLSIPPNGSVAYKLEQAYRLDDDGGAELKLLNRAKDAVSATKLDMPARSLTLLVLSAS